MDKQPVPVRMFAEACMQMSINARRDDKPKTAAFWATMGYAFMARQANEGWDRIRRQAGLSPHTVDWLAKFEAMPIPLYRHNVMWQMTRLARWREERIIIS